MRVRATIFATLCAAALAIACQQAPVKLDYVKYTSDADVPRMNIQDAKAAVDSGSAVIVDSRAEAEYKAEHIQGAISVPFGVGADQKFSTLPQGKKIIVYCS